MAQPSARSSSRLRATLYADVEREWNVRRLRGNDAGSRNVTQWNRLPRSRGSSAFLGYAANRIFGERHGTIATALISGAYSSTAVTQALSQRLGSEECGGAEPAGIARRRALH